MKRVVITGATGMISIALIKYLISQDIEVLAIINPNSIRKNDIPINKLVTIIERDISQLSNLVNSISKKYDIFYHFAWTGTFGDSRNDVCMQNLNIKYTLDAVQLASLLGCNTFIGAGSQAEYGNVSCKLSSDIIANPNSAYGIAKYTTGKLSSIYAEKLGLKHIWTRILSIYGPYDGENTMITSSIKKLLSKQKPLYTKAGQIWDYLYCDDAARAFYLIGEKGKNKTIYCLGSGEERHLYDYITKMRDIIDPSLEIGLGEIEYNPNQVMFLSADITELTRDTGFLPNFSFEQGIKETIEWYKSEIVK